MSVRKAQERALGRMVELLQHEPIPVPCWDDIEHELMDRIAQPALPATSMPQPASRRFARPLLRRDDSRARPSGTLVRCVQLAAIAAAIALGIGAGAQSGSPASTSAPPARWVDASSIALLPSGAGETANLDRDLGALKPGDGIEAQVAPISLARPGAVRFTLAAGSRAIVKASGSSDVVALERGMIRVEVTPHNPAGEFVEAVAVEVDQTRVAAHGTVFTVERRADGVVVDVEHGTVAIGPVGRDAITTGHLLIGPRRAMFSLDGARSARVLPPAEPSLAPLLQAAHPIDRQLSAEPSTGAALALFPGPAKAPGVAAREPPLLRAQAVSQAPALAAPEGASAPPLDAPAVGAVQPAARVLTQAAALGDLRRCFNKLYGGASASVRVSITATLTFSAQSDGRLAAVRFQPPLEGAFQSCVWAAVKDGRLAGDARSMSIDFALGP